MVVLCPSIGMLKQCTFESWDDVCRLLLRRWLCSLQLTLVHSTTCISLSMIITAAVLHLRYLIVSCTLS